MKNKQVKTCTACHKPFTNRKRWESRGQWEQIKYCSKACRVKSKNISSKSGFS